MNNWYDKIQISENWQRLFEKYASMIARDENELLEYEKKPDHNTKAVAIRKEKILLAKDFMNATKQLINAQSEELQDMNRKAGMTNYYKDKFEILENFSRQCGVNTELLPYLKKKDFNNW